MNGGPPKPSAGFYDYKQVAAKPVPPATADASQGYYNQWAPLKTAPPPPSNPPPPPKPY